MIPLTVRCAPPQGAEPGATKLMSRHRAAAISIPSAGINHLQGALVIAGSNSLTIKVRVLLCRRHANAVLAHSTTSVLCDIALGSG